MSSEASQVGVKSVKTEATTSGGGPGQPAVSTRAKAMAPPRRGAVMKKILGDISSSLSSTSPSS